MMTNIKQPRTFRFKATDNGEYSVHEKGTHIGFVRWYWDGWRAHELNGKELSGSCHKVRSTACYDLPVVGAA